ncbi:MAG TPA: TetR family transcriptional regulator [Mycobacteriales bacterium]|nr:TetR family transcriptional regulator [Mycobacteriales bacterium]
MSSSPSEPAATRLGLRERKKAKTRQRIQDEALRLFAEQGYDATTIEQIADAAEISPSTFFRYYPTKEDTVVQDQWDVLFAEIFTDHSDPRQPLDIVRDTVRSALAQATPELIQQARERTQLVMSVPALRARSLEFNRMMLETISRNLAGKLGRDPHDPDILVFGGALAGTMVAVMLAWAHRDMDLADLSDLLERAFDHLAGGINF